MISCKYCGEKNVARVKQGGVCVVCRDNLLLIGRLKIGIPAVVNGSAQLNNRVGLQCPNCYTKFDIELVRT